ncbi:hypothetical protein Hanom_Chr02g00157221 [Helianthus anomalus]
MINMGLSSSGGYYSSNERPNKEPKKVGDVGLVFNEDDPFELDPIILGIDSNVVKTRGEGPVNISNSFKALMEENDVDIHNQNGVTRDADRPFEGSGYRSSDCIEAEVIAEVSGTKQLGANLGVQLEGFDGLIKNSVQGDGVQSGLK